MIKERNCKNKNGLEVKEKRMELKYLQKERCFSINYQILEYSRGQKYIPHIPPKIGRIVLI